MLTGGSGLQPHDKTQGTKDMSPSQFSRTLDFKEKTANLWHANTSLLSFPIKGQQRTQLLHHYNSFYMKFSIYLDKGNVIRELSEIPSRYQTAGISLRNLPSSWITAYEKKKLSTKRFCHKNVGFSTKLLQKNKKYLSGSKIWWKVMSPVSSHLSLQMSLKIYNGAWNTYLKS